MSKIAVVNASMKQTITIVYDPLAQKVDIATEPTLEPLQGVQLCLGALQGFLMAHMQKLTGAPIPEATPEVN